MKTGAGVPDRNEVRGMPEVLGGAGALLALALLAAIAVLGVAVRTSARRRPPARAVVALLALGAAAAARADYRIHFGPPMRFEGPPSPGAVAERVAEVQPVPEGLMKGALARRRYVFF